LFAEELPHRLAAEKREAQIKRWIRAKKLALIKGNMDALRNLSKSRD